MAHLFQVSNVHLPFSNGGYLAFAGETGHFFALHEVHDAVFVDEANLNARTIPVIIGPIIRVRSPTRPLK